MKGENVVMKLQSVLPMLLTAEGGTTVVQPSAWQPIIDAFNAQISVPSVIGVVAVVIGSAVGFVFMWFGVRKSISVLMAAFQKGKLKV